MAPPPEELAPLRAEVDELKRLQDLFARRLDVLARRLAELEPAGGVARPTAPRAQPAPPPIERAAAQAKPKPKRDVEALAGVIINRVGVVALLLGISFFLKYAYDSEWIGPWGRVAIGIVGGAVLLALGEREQHKKHPLFAQGLTGGGIGVLYASFFAAFEFYKLVNQTSAFGLMALVTVTSAVAALRYASLAIAVLGLVGGFVTPVLLSTGQDKQLALFSYVALLDLGAFAVAWVQSRRSAWWRVLVPLALLGTVVLQVGWMDKFYEPEKLWRTAAIAVGFLVLFTLLPVADALRRRAGGPVEGARTAAFVMDAAVLAVTALFFGGLLFGLAHDYRTTPLIWGWGGEERAALYPLRQWQGMVPLLLSWGFAVAAGLVLRRSPGEGRLVAALAILSGLGLVLVPPAQFERGTVAIGWAVLAALAAGAAQGPARRPLLFGGAMLWAVALVWALASEDGRRTLFTSRETAAYLCLAAATFAARHAAASGRGWRWPLAAALHVAVLIALSLEVYAWGWRGFALSVPADADSAFDVRAGQVALSVLWTLYGAGLVAFGFFRSAAHLRWLGLGLLVVTAGKVFFVDLATLKAVYRIVSFLGLGLLFVLVSYLYLRARRKGTQPEAT